jgi:twitching motility two-component system response regulator PilG
MQPSKGKELPHIVTGSNTKLQGLKVLVIDDSKTIRRTAETLLAKEGCEVFTAIDGFDALAKSRITSLTSCSSTS